MKPRVGAAIQCFWANGYGATSVRNLASETGITGASIYNAFGDKGGLYPYLPIGFHTAISTWILA
jgi:AcrR family transcriptional regulator